MKTSRALVILSIALVFISSTITPSFALEENGVIEMPYSENTPAIDGKWTTSEEWSDASQTIIKKGEYVAYVLTKHDRDSLYVMIDFIADQTKDETTISLTSEFVLLDGFAVCFDTDSDGGNSPDIDDFCFAAGGFNKFRISGHVAIAKGTAGGTFSIDHRNIPKDFISKIGFSSANDPIEEGRDHRIYEFKIPLAYLHRQDQYGFFVRMFDYSSKTVLTWPESAPDEGEMVDPPYYWGAIKATQNTVTTPPVPVISISTISLSFGNIRVSEVSQPKTVIVSNTGSGDLKVNSIRASGEFSIEDISTPLTVPPGSKAEFNVKFAPISEGEKKGSITITSNDLSSPSLTISASGVGTLEPPPLGGGCLIATAAFGSELSPQVQFLRNFRDNHILSTLAGSSFMNVFNAWYYSFSPYVADYERQQPWLQQTVKALIYPLLGILQISEKGYSSIEGEYGALVAGAIASSMIGAFYFSPVALSVKQIRMGKFNYRLAISVIAIVSAAVMASIVTSNAYVLMAMTSLFVLTMLSVSAILVAKLIITLYRKFT